MSDTTDTAPTPSAPDDAEAFRTMANIVIEGAFLGSACAELLASGHTDAALAACEGNAESLQLHVQLASLMQDLVRAGCSLMQAVESLVADDWAHRRVLALGPGLH